MRGTTIIYACPDTLRLIAKEQIRFSPTRTSLWGRAVAAWKVFTGRADALSWEHWATFQIQQIKEKTDG